MILMFTMQSEFSSAWVPPTRGMGSGKEETCVKSSAQVPILAICFFLLILAISYFYGIR